jgi:hypothetical protein
MLQAFAGIIDANGLRSLRQDNGRIHPGRADTEAASVPFWAILDTNDATRVLRELLSGNRRRALRLLEEASVSLGSDPRHR